MIGILVCGHDRFGSAMTAVVKLVAGMPHNFGYADYRQEDTADDFELAFQEAIKSLDDSSEGILVFTDIVQGTAYKTAIGYAEKHPEQKVIVISGTNLGALTETAIARGYINDPEVLANLAVEHGKKQVMRANAPIEEEEPSE